MAIRALAAQLPEAVWTEACVGTPQIIAGQVDVQPADRDKVGKQPLRDHFVGAPHDVERMAEIHGVPQRDGSGDEGEPARTVLLASTEPPPQNESETNCGTPKGGTEFTL